MKVDGLFLQSVVDGALVPLSIAENCVYTNAHLSVDLNCACAVVAQDHESEPTCVAITHVNTCATAALKFGSNTSISDGATWLTSCTIPIRVHNGMVNLLARKSA